MTYDLPDNDAYDSTCQADYHAHSCLMHHQYTSLSCLSQVHLGVQDLVQFLKQHVDECGIIYARLRTTCDYLAAALIDADIEAAAYHAGLDTTARHRTQADWTQGACNIVVATVAFGMGIDQADVRWVVHWNAATSLEGFYQESGRAGRDGQPSLSLLYSCQAELCTLPNKGDSLRAMASYCMVSTFLQYCSSSTVFAL